MARIGITVSADKKSISKVNHTVNDALLFLFIFYS